MHLAVYDAETAANAVAFLAEAQKAFPFRITHVLTDRGSCFTAEDFERACATLKVIRRTTRPYTPQTTDEIEQPLSSEMCYFLSLRATAWQRAEREVQAPPRRRISVAPRLRRPHLVSACAVANAA